MILSLESLQTKILNLEMSNQSYYIIIPYFSSYIYGESGKIPFKIKNILTGYTKSFKLITYT